MIFHFDAVRLNRDGWRWKPWTLSDLKAIYARFDRELEATCWHTVFLSNHDNPRPVSSFGDDSPLYRVPSAKVLATMLLTLKGTPFIYQGDELGMTNYPFTQIEQFDDIEVKNAWKIEVLTNRLDGADYLFHLRKTSRDHSRTPMQWDDSPNAGFTRGVKPWFAVHPNYKEINARQELADPNSVYHYFKQLIELRKKNLAFVYGDYADLDPTNPFLFAYTRTLGSEQFLVALNFSTNSVAYSLPTGLKTGQLLLSNLEATEENASAIHLEPWEARIYRTL
jgi:oligo-1,6-glucosidase